MNIKVKAALGIAENIAVSSITNGLVVTGSKNKWMSESFCWQLTSQLAAVLLAHWLICVMIHFRSERLLSGFVHVI